MMKLRAGGLVVLGLSELNVQKLKQGLPIAFDGKEVRLPGVRIAIIYGETEHKMERDLINLGYKIPQ